MAFECIVVVYRHLAFLYEGISCRIYVIGARYKALRSSAQVVDYRTIVKRSTHRESIRF